MIREECEQRGGGSDFFNVLKLFAELQFVVVFTFLFLDL